MDKELKEIRKTMDEQNENINKNDRKEPTRNSGLKSTWTEMKNSLEGFNSRFDQLYKKKKFSKLEDRAFEITQSGEQK